METKELRIGNYIHPLLDENEVAEICYISENDLGFERLSDKEYFQGNAIKPIPLTEEWLLKFGFELEDDKIYYHLDSYEDIYITKTSYSFSIYNATHFTNIKQGIKHVHQLQNLYFALTNEELKLT
jgi:hypothetical protein